MVNLLYWEILKVNLIFWIYKGKVYMEKIFIVNVS